MVSKNRYSISREKMVANQLVDRGITDEKILKAFKNVPREAFVPKSMKHNSYKDTPLPIGKNQTISQPYIIAKMMEMLNLSGKEKVLEIGTGSGYQTALLCECADVVYSIERIEEFTKKSRKVLDELGYYKAHLITSDGTMGYPQKAPYDRIIVSAAAPKIPKSLKDQLNNNYGIMVIPVGGSIFQQLIKIIKKNGNIRKEKEDGCRFVPLIGENGWKEK
ncbi:MAG: protein-L-isoaspartate(D-aspartate) O-methyltransferase [Candidatus Mcinerneyibacterium aminivorans]|uniref:Protein-L-isoaspartate O-methyltransferase n=1 Tax=Candidatus Mcinerneyibacterium aminivorans TaxID=2703815 RepID=A0A5D0MEK2_9BACT|nr:MAG: protein-L-isoaspartate(D-aspartate) O-methyltransferase [Candidatus Mcinerneyibacterium aminivorans]